MQTQASAPLPGKNHPLPGPAGSTGFWVWFYYIRIKTLSCQGALPGGSGGCRNSTGKLKERLSDLEETLEPIELNPICHFTVEETDGKLLAY